MSIRSEDITYIISFIKIVEKHPCLWNYDLKEYSKGDVISLAWKNIATELEDTERNCRERWKNIRCAFVRSLRPAKPGSCAKRPYYLATHMSFLVPYLKGSSHSGNSSDTNNLDFEEINTENSYEYDELDVSEDVLSLASDIATDHTHNDEPSEHNLKPPLQKKLKRDAMHLKASNNDANVLIPEWIQMKMQGQNKQEDADMLFLLSLLPDIKKLDQRRKRVLKLKFMSSLNEMLDESTSLWVPSSNSTRTMYKEEISDEIL